MGRFLVVRIDISVWLARFDVQRRRISSSGITISGGIEMGVVRPLVYRTWATYARWSAAQRTSKRGGVGR